MHIKLFGSHLQEIDRDVTYDSPSVYAEGTFLIRRTGADHAVLTS